MMDAEEDPWAPPVDPWAAIRVKREASIRAKEESSLVKMNYANAVPTGFHKDKIVPSRHREYSQEEQTSRIALEQKRLESLLARRQGTICAEC